MKLKTFSIFVIMMYIFSGCAKEVSEYNKPATYWYAKMIEAVANRSFDKADGYFASLQSEHISSPLLEEATMIMAQAHMNVGEYLLAEHFLDEYIRRFADPQEREFASYLKMHAKFMALPNPRRDQTLIHNALKDGEDFKLMYPNSPYTPAIDTMLVKLYLARANLNKTIALLYKRLDKPVAQEFYENKQPETWIDWTKVNPPNTAWYKEMFEGDGSSSWYAFLLPDSKSVLSQDSDGNTKETRSTSDMSKEGMDSARPDKSTSSESKSSSHSH
ncbi:outer membrane protein assembly factor BamD [Sulfurimonas sp. MAG313]|nr:outer membrane protein assembly factor BamD [Sulfurimonas sp. MAG313]MDF1880686.1 outer membrane protein assembly factor BamD [Sulfurimonas sp. MAG313]